MKRIILFFLGISSVGFLQAQIGVNTEEPKVSLDVHAGSVGAGTAEGLSAPRLTLSQLASKDSKYLPEQTGALVYVTDVTGTASAKTRNVIAVGYYYFDGTLWQTVGPDKSLGFFYMPSIVFPTNTSDPSYNPSNQTFTIDLYGIYSAQFGLNDSGSSTKSPGASSLPIATSNTLEYLITYFDNTVYRNVAVSNVGVLTYQLAAVVDVTDKTFMNVLFKVK